MYVFGAILIGFASALLSGMFGIGGAAVSTPSLRLILKTPPGIALGTTLPVTIPTAAAGAFTYWRRGFVDSKVALLCCCTGVVGATGGAIATRWLNPHYLMIATGLMVLYVSGMTIRRGTTGRGVPAGPDEASPLVESAGAEAGECEVAPDEAGECYVVSVPVALAIGFVAGAFSGLLGVGGGVLMIPGFLYLLHMPLRRSIATSLAVIVVIAIPGTIVHSFLGHISWSLVLYMVLGALPGAYLGARLNLRTAERVLYILFGSMLGAFGILFIVNEIIGIVGGK
jgi:uncharacterized membrane protein YfcA